MFCPGWIRLCISILEVWTGHRHVTEKWEGAMRSLGLGGSLPDYLSHSPAVWNPAGEDMKLWCRWGAGGGGSQSRGQRRLLGAAELDVSHQPSLFQLDQVDAKDVKKTLKQMDKSNCTFQRIRRSHKTQSARKKISIFWAKSVKLQVIQNSELLRQWRKAIHCLLFPMFGFLRGSLPPSNESPGKRLICILITDNHYWSQTSKKPTSVWIARKLTSSPSPAADQQILMKAANK